jgi:hypothetical protein
MINVYPIKDIEEHIIEGTQCWCCPEITEEYGQLTVAYNAFDGRTLNENRKVQLADEVETD